MSLVKHDAMRVTRLSRFFEVEWGTLPNYHGHWDCGPIFDIQGGTLGYVDLLSLQLQAFTELPI